MQAELFCGRPRRPVISQTQCTRDKASVCGCARAWACVCVRARVGVRMQRCICLSVSWCGSRKWCKTNRVGIFKHFWPFRSYSVITVEKELLLIPLKCQSITHSLRTVSITAELPQQLFPHRIIQTICDARRAAKGIKRESVNVKQAMTGCDNGQIYPHSLWSLLLPSLNRFNLPLNTNPFQTQLWSLSRCKLTGLEGLRQIHYSFHTPIWVSSAACNVLHLSPCQLALLFALLSGSRVLLGSSFFI